LREAREKSYQDPFITNMPDVVLCASDLLLQGPLNDLQTSTFGSNPAEKLRTDFTFLKGKCKLIGTKKQREIYDRNLL
jgi:hypothetical protein